MKKTKVLALDFDNCLVLNEMTRKGSEEIKDEAWFMVFSEIPRNTLQPILEKIKQEFVGGKGDRKNIIDKIYQYFKIAETDLANGVAHRCEHFDALVQKGIKEIGISQKTRDAIATLSIKLPLYINTGTPHGEVLKSLNALKILQFFKGVYGRPGTKIGNLRDIIAVESVNPDELLFVDDQQIGWLIAQEIGCKFIGMHTTRNHVWNKNTQPFPIIHSLAELLEESYFPTAHH